MTIRRSALRWLATTHGVRDGDIFTSRHYPAAQSWTGHDAWWLQIPLHRLEALGPRPIHLVCEAGSADADFHYLRVPADFLHENLAGLDVPGDGRTVSLFLSAEADSRFRDERGPAHLDFAPFERTAPATD